jgi:Tautomerase enzyme
MPFIRVNCPKGALTAEQKAKLAPRLVHALIRQEIGATEGPTRFAEALELGKKMKAARLS